MGEKIIRSVRYYGSQSRGFTLPHDLDQGKSEAKYEDGLLELTLPKKEATSAKQVAVKYRFRPACFARAAEAS
jgi:HSP20 family protein